MPLSDIFRVKEYKEKICELRKERSALQSEVMRLSSMYTDEYGQAIDAKKTVEQMNARQALLERSSLILQLIILLQKRLKEMQEREIVELDEIRLLQDFALYKPTYSFATSSEYKDELERVRNEQKQMIKDKYAAVCRTEWLVDGNRAKGRQMTNNNIKQALVTFNTECENAISKVTFSNYESMKKRIDRSFDKLNKLNEVNQISIARKYLESKHQELSLAYEYARKVQEEKEEIRA